MRTGQLTIVFMLMLTVIVLFGACAEGDDDDDTNTPAPADDDDDDNNDDDDNDDDNDDNDNDDDTTPFEPAAYVDPFIGTAGDHGQLHPAATTPFGLVKLGPDTQPGGHAGYDYGARLVRGFSHTRIGGVGCNGAGGSVRLLPFLEGQGRFATLNKTSETASPGYYSVILQDVQSIGVELTATAHVGRHRYTFAEGGVVRVRLTLNEPFADNRGSDWTLGEAEVTGRVSATNVCNRGRYEFFFAAAFDHPVTAWEEVPASQESTDVILTFDLGKEKVLQAKVGLATVDAAQATANRDAETPGWDFDATHAQARTAWNEHLGRVVVTGAEEHRRLFYTLLYRASLLPVDITGVDGAYRGTDGEVHAAAGHVRYHGWSLWDTYRNKYALQTLLDPERVGDWSRSLVELYQQGKADWATDHEPCPTVRTEHAPALLLDAAAKGIDDFGLADAFDEILAEAAALAPDSPDTVLEASYDYWAVAELAELLGDQTHRDLYRARALEYESTWLEHFAVMGEDADVMHARGLYEGTLWQYRWAVVHDIEGIAAMVGGRDELRSQLEYYFAEELHNHGNEPDIHAPFLFNHLGAPWRSQQIVRELLLQPVNQWYGTHDKWPIPYHGHIYRDQPKGFIPEMDDDAGTMSAWFVLASLGLYPVTIGRPIYMLTGPIFSEAICRVDGDVRFVIRAENLSDEAMYIQEVYLNGAALERAWITHDELVAGGELLFVMGEEPNPAWGADVSQLPPNGIDWVM
ncbi:MAG: GH92 family glycosyl hydrolase [Candidatus Lernaella stagnicola]|nr:GH92 family glycosyl hydrolase [Candidatus Lernaella stagnicola]